MIEDKEIRNTVQELIMKDVILNGTMEKGKIVERIMDYIFVIYGTLPNRLPDTWFKEALEDVMRHI